MASDSAIEVATMLDAASAALSDLSLHALEEADLEQLLSVVRDTQGRLAVLVARIGRQADLLAANGHSAPAPDLLRRGGRVTGRRARTEARHARALARFPAAGEGSVAGSLGIDHLDALARHTDRLSDGEVAALDLTDLLRSPPLPADTFAATIKRAVAAAAPERLATDAAERRAASSVRHWFDDDTGMGHLHALLDPERYEAVVAAIDGHTTSLAATAGGQKDANLAASAFVDLVTGSSAASGRLPHITVVVNAATGEAQTGAGHPINSAALTRLACTAVVQRVTLDTRGVPINVGRKRRTATDAQWAALRAIHTTCAWDGCHRPLDHCQLHHLHWWRHGGRTDLNNLVPLCSQHHHRVHDEGWSLRLLADRSLQILRPDGTLHTTTDPPRRTWLQPALATAS